MSATACAREQPGGPSADTLGAQRPRRPKFRPEHNARWLETTRPIVEAFFHARYFLEMAVRYGRSLEAPPTLMPSGWAALLSLYGLR
jgi:hypothetical protein